MKIIGTHNEILSLFELIDCPFGENDEIKCTEGVRCFDCIMGHKQINIEIERIEG